MPISIRSAVTNSPVARLKLAQGFGIRPNVIFCSGRPVAVFMIVAVMAMRRGYAGAPSVSSCRSARLWTGNLIHGLSLTVREGRNWNDRMSVAFRRESDEEHLEPKFERPIPLGPNLVTARGLELIGSRVAELEGQIEAGGVESEIATLKRELRYWQTRQITAELAPEPTGRAVEFGSRVDVILNGKPRTFHIVGDDEADPAAGLISFTAPLSRAMLDAEIGEVLPFGAVEDAIRIVGIDAP